MDEWLVGLCPWVYHDHGAIIMSIVICMIGIIRARDRDGVMSSYRTKAKESIVIKLKQQVADGAMIGYQQERGQEKTCRYAQVIDRHSDEWYEYLW